MNRLQNWLLSFRNVVYFMVSLLTFLAVSSQAKQAPPSPAFQSN
jgi:hypothetical protein